jgi:hypothetical protein
MRTYLKFFSVILLLLAGCEENFDINASYQDISVIYGLVDPGEDTIFLKINKAYLGEGNMLEMAKIEDSSMYVNGLNASIEEWENGNFIRSYSLDTITVKNKEEGVFYNPYQIIYYTPFEPVTSREYHLKVEVNNRTITAKTNIVNNFTISRPSAGSKFVSYPEGTKGAIEWESAKYGKRYEVVIRIKYKEVLKDSPDTVYTYVDWSMGTKKSVADKGGEEMAIEFNNDAFYTFIANQIPYIDAAEEDNVRERYTNDIDYIIAVAETTLNTYIEVNEPTNSIIQERPEYTNISNGIGIFSSRFKNIRTKKVSPETIESIQTNCPQLKFVY